MDNPIAINASLATSCIRCARGGTVETVIQWRVGDNFLSSGSNGVTVVDPFLVINNAATFLQLRSGPTVVIQCGNLFQGVTEAGELFLQIYNHFV